MRVNKCDQCGAILPQNGGYHFISAYKFGRLYVDLCETCLNKSQSLTTQKEFLDKEEERIKALPPKPTYRRHKRYVKKTGDTNVETE